MKLLLKTFACLVTLTALSGCTQKDEELHKKTEALEAKEAELEAKLEKVGEKIDAVEASLEQIESLNQRVDFLEGKDPDISFTKELTQIKALYPEAKQTPTGLHYIVVEEGEGNSPSIGTKISAHYTGKTIDGREFDSSVSRGRPYSFKVGMGAVIKGWDEAFLSMKAGEKRKLIIPSPLGYGERGYGPIPANTILVFDVELVSIDE